MSREQEKAPAASYFDVVNGLVSKLAWVTEIAITEVESLHEAAMLDPLTSLGNRRALVLAYEELQDNHERRRSGDIGTGAGNNSIIFFDIDNFKEINDTLGHSQGDEILISLADMVRSRIRKRDIATRPAGDEFVILLPRASERQAAIVAEQLRDHAEASSRVKISVGVAEIGEGETLESSLNKADNALYMAKDKGGNLVVRYTEYLAQLEG